MTNENELTSLKQANAGLDLFRIYPLAFGFANVFFFAWIFVKTLTISLDIHVRHWIGLWPTLVSILPLVFIAIALAMHVVQKRPSRLATTIGLAAPCFVFGTMGYSMGWRAMSLGAAFSTTDCATSLRKLKMEDEWKAAKSFKSACGSSNTSAGFTPATIEECDGYLSELAKHPSWKYLAQLEEEAACGGWCEPAAPMWLFSGDVRDACSAVAGTVLSTKVLTISMQIATYCIALLALTMIGVGMVGNSFRAHGLDW